MQIFHNKICIIQKKAVLLQYNLKDIHNKDFYPLCKHSGWDASLALFISLKYVFPNFRTLS